MYTFSAFIRNQSSKNKRPQTAWERRQMEIRHQLRNLGEEDISDSDDDIYVPGAPKSGKYFDVSGYESEDRLDASFFDMLRERPGATSIKPLVFFITSPIPL